MLPRLPGFPPPHFPPQSPPSHPLDRSLGSQQQPSRWDCSAIPKPQLQATAPARGPASLSGVCTAAARTVRFSFHLGRHGSAVSLSAVKVSPLTQTIAPVWELTPASVPHLPSAGPVLLTLLFPPSSFILPSFAWVCSFPLARPSCALSAGVLMQLCV